MPRNIPPALAARLRDHSTTLCYLLKVVPREAETFGITTCNRDVDFDDGSGIRTYRAKRGYTASDTETKSDLSVNNAEADGLVAEYPADGVTKEGIARGDYDGAAYMHYLIDYEHPEDGFVLIGAGTVGRVTTSDDLTMQLEMRSLTQTLKQASMIELTSITCRAKFGDARCKMPLEWVEGTVIGVGDESDRTFYVELYAEVDSSGVPDVSSDSSVEQTSDGFVVDFPDAHFVPGVVHWDTGSNAERENEVDTYELTSDGAQVTLVIPTHQSVEVGDTFRIRQDCDKSRAMCRDRYHNVLNFRGEPDIPRGDATSLGAPKPS